METPKLPERKVSATDRAYIMLAMRIVGSFGVAIAAPVVCFALIGKWLDGRYGTAPWFLILSFVIAAALSSGIVWRRAKDFGREFEEIDEKKKV